MPNDLVKVDQLSSFPGAPFAPEIVDAAVGTVRSIAGWHIAGPREETVTLDSRGGYVLRLPTKYLTAVTEIRDMTGDTPSVITGWRISRSGKVSLSGYCWPCGYDAIEVDIVHGYDTCPPGLLPVIAGYCLAATTDPNVSQESLGAWAQTLRDPDTPEPDSEEVPNALAALSLAWGAA